MKEINASKTDILREIQELVRDELFEPGDNVGYTMPGGKHHIFIELEDIGNPLHGEELIYRIEPNKIDEDGAAEPMADVYTADFGDFTELLLGCVWCMEQFDADLEQSKDLAAADRVEVDLGYATLVAEKGTTPGYKEVYVGLENKDGLWTQDLAIIGGKYHYTKEDEVVQDKGMSVKVYSDKDDEDITHEFSIGIYEPEEEIEFSAETRIEAAAANIDIEKLGGYLKEEMILEFDSEKECMDYFNLYDGQNFNSVEEMKEYQGEYGFGLNGKWYHISFDEALNVRTNLDWIRQNATESREDTATRYMVNVVDHDDGYRVNAFVYAESEAEMREKISEKYDPEQWTISGWEVQNVPAQYRDLDEGTGQESDRTKSARTSLDDKIKSAQGQVVRGAPQTNEKEKSWNNVKE